MATLRQLGWNDFFEEEYQSYKSQGFDVGRVAIENRDNYMVLTEQGDFSAEVTGRLLHLSESTQDFPKVGDWVVISTFPDEGKALIHDILARQTTFSRKAASKRTEVQVMATNLDHVYVVQSLDVNFNVNRIERYLVMIRESGAEPGVILNKSDLVDHPEEYLDEAKHIAGKVPIFVVSAKTHDGIENLSRAIQPGETIALVGSSGVGKSTIINALVGKDIQKTEEVRSGDSKGRHTTTRRELILLPDGGLLIDTPGMREFQVWTSDSGVEEVFGDILDLAEECRFRDCTHTHETDCAVQEAIEEGEMSEEHLENYLKLQRELEFLESKQNDALYREREERWKKIHENWKQMKKHRKKFR